jgi:hypothetical protein
MLERFLDRSEKVRMRGGTVVVAPATPAAITAASAIISSGADAAAGEICVQLSNLRTCLPAQNVFP